MLWPQDKKCRGHGHGQGLEGAGRTLPLKPAEGADPASPWILDVWPPELCKDKCLLFQDTEFVMLCYGSLRKQRWGWLQSFPLFEEEAAEAQRG